MLGNGWAGDSLVEDIQKAIAGLVKGTMATTDLDPR